MNKKGMAFETILLLVFLLLVIGGLAFWVRGYYKESKDSKTTTTISTIPVIEYLPLNKTCKATSNCTDYIKYLGIQIDTECRNNLCFQKVQK